MSCRFLGLIEEEWKTVYQGMGIKYWGEKAKAQC